jgi:ketosteroid isomerase-like protein
MAHGRRAVAERSNVDTLVQGFAGWGKDNPARIADVVAESCEMHVPASLPYGGVRRGPTAIAQWFARELWEFFDEFSSTPVDVVDGGDKIAVPVRVIAVAKNGRRMDIDNLWLYEFRDGRLVRLQVYVDTAIAGQTVEGVDPTR